MGLIGSPWKTPLLNLKGSDFHVLVSITAWEFWKTCVKYVIRLFNKSLLKKKLVTTHNTYTITTDYYAVISIFKVRNAKAPF